jgi:DNA-binding transcriptional regulator YiaG
VQPAEVRAARERLGLTTQQLATALECTVRAVQQWESGARNVAGPARVAIAFMLQALPAARSRRLTAADRGTRAGLRS